MVTPTLPGVETTREGGAMDDTAGDTEGTDNIEDTEDTDDTEDAIVGVADKLAVGDAVDDATCTVTHAKWKYVKFMIAIPKILQSLSTAMHGHKSGLF